MGSWALAEPISRAHIAHPQCAPTMRAHIKKHEQTLLIFPKLRAHVAPPQGAPTSRAHNVRSHCAPIWVIWGPLTPYGFIGSHMGPHTAALVEKGARAVGGRTTLSRALESFYFEPSGGRTSPRQFQPPPLDSLLRRFSRASARESGASNRPPLSRANHETRAAQQPRPPLTSR